jgi:hypothetical protein
MQNISKDVVLAILDEGLKMEQEGVYDRIVTEIKATVVDDTSSVVGELELNILNASTENPAFSVFATINGEEDDEVELREDIARELYIDATKFLTPEQIAEVYQPFFTSPIEHEEVEEWEMLYLAYVDVSDHVIYFFVGGEDQEPAVFDVLNRLSVAGGYAFEDAIQVDIKKFFA